MCFFIVSMFWVSKRFSVLLISLFYVPKHSCNVPLFLHVVNRLYILSCAFCCAHFLECTTYVERVQHDLRIFAAISGLLIPMVPDDYQYNFCDKSTFVFLFVNLQMYCPLYELPLNAVLIFTNWLKDLVWISYSLRGFLGCYLSFQYHVIPAL